MLPNENYNDCFYDIALTFVPEVGIKTARALLTKFGNAESIFKASISELKKINGVGEARAKSFKEKIIFERTEEELKFVEKNNIRLLFFNGSDYPKRLRHCDDAPSLLYYKGNTDLNSSKLIAVIGTRKNTDYGQRTTEYLIEELKSVEDLIIVSGLAAGIDAIAHKAALRNSLQTVGVLGHSLDRIYPFTNKSLADDMIQHGGLLSEFPSGTKPDRQNFPVRNRVVAGMTDITVVVESEIKGGAMITAYMALSYNRDVAAIPGRVFDSKSSGPNHLIKRNIAVPITSGEDLLELMGWNNSVSNKTSQKQLFIELSETEQVIVNLLRTKDKLHADELLLQTSFKSSELASVLLQLEMQGLVKSLPGKYYRLN